MCIEGVGDCLYLFDDLLSFLLGAGGGVVNFLVFYVVMDVLVVLRAYGYDDGVGLPVVLGMG